LYYLLFIFTKIIRLTFIDGIDDEGVSASNEELT